VLGQSRAVVLFALAKIEPLAQDIGVTHKMSDFARLEAEAIQRKKDYCAIEGICYTCWQQDPVDEVPLDRATKKCPNCDDSTDFQTAPPPSPSIAAAIELPPSPVDDLLVEVAESPPWPQQPEQPPPLEFLLSCPNCCEKTLYSYDDEGHCSAYCARKGPNTTCWGCRDDQPNQLAHVDFGGCLYSDD
jgi:hypothetical protein